MYLHLGNDILINTKNLIGIFDIENSSTSQNTKNFLSNAGKTDRVFNVSYEMPKTFIVCIDEDLKETVYISQISCATLRKRIKIAQTQGY
ncbi:MAG: DUF370 domain-containing protein [Clostridiales bacterium]|mgnify:CR=1 FL=1|nr:DUF370 domain-containing protein [Clostridiales bacterium]